MSGTGGAVPRLQPRSVNEKDEQGRTIIPVVRAPGFARFSPNSFSVWVTQAIAGVVEPKIEIILQYVENAEANHRFQVGTSNPMEKDVRLQISELASMVMTPSLALQLQAEIESAMRLYNESVLSQSGKA